jgi:adenylosuccinate lyase
MRVIWSERRKRELWRTIWVSLAKVESEFGIVEEAQVRELASRARDIDLPRSLEIEAEIKHDLMAEIKAFAEQCPGSGGIIHLGATSMDIEDNADALRTKDSLDLIIEKLDSLLGIFADKIEAYADLPVMAFTHIQPAEPSTLGYRLAVWAQDLFLARKELRRRRTEIKGKGFKGAVGTSASYAELFGLEGLEKFQARMSEELGIGFFPVSTQTSTRIQDYLIMTALASLGAGLHKMAFDLRILQSPPIGELSEPFGAKQVGSSAMPFKRNPIAAEKIDSLARLLAAYPSVAWGDASLSLLERTLDDSANRRVIIPEAFLISDELIDTAAKIIGNLVVNDQAIRATFRRYAPFACTERVLMAMAKQGADRQETHERLRNHALSAWAAMRQGGENPLETSLAEDAFFLDALGAQRLSSLMVSETYVGDAPDRAKSFARTLKEALADGLD